MLTFPILKRLAWALPLMLAGCAAAPMAGPPPAFLWGPYKDLTLALDPRTGVFSTAAGGIAVPVTTVLAKGMTLSWAFATGECGRETLGGVDATRLAATNVEAFNRAGIDYIVSTGGEGGLFTCGTDAGMEAFIARYASPRLVGVDLDIEAKQTPEIVDALVRRVVAAQRRHPTLRFSFTLPTQAASDGSRASLNAQGRDVLETIRRHGLTGYTINLMTMDYGPPAPANCVVANGVCDMGASAIQAADNLHEALGVPFAQIALTAMIGVNDVAGNDFTLADVARVTRYARERRLAGLHFWALDRDTPCPRPAQGASATCSGLESVPARAYLQAFEHGLR